MKLNIAFVVLLSAAAITPNAHADLVGSSVTISANYPTFGAVYSTAGPFTVTSNLVLPSDTVSGFHESFSLTGDQITITSFGVYDSVAFDGFVFDFTGAPTITSATVDSTSTLSPDAISFTGSEVAVNLAGLSAPNTATTIIDVDTASSTAPSIVPEPTTLTLLTSGLFALGTLRRYRPTQPPSQ
jgi:hypothetical protein